MKYRAKSAEIGVCYYPEHWDKTLWRQDLSRMLSHGIKTIRIAEFAWNKMEQREGKFDFSFFHEFLKLAQEMGMNVILGTPTATPLAYFSGDYYQGEVACAVNEYGKGKVYHYGSTFTRDTAEYFLSMLSLNEPFERIVSCTEDVEVQKRGDYLFLLNYTGCVQKVFFNSKVTNVDTGEFIVGEWSLSPYGSNVFKV